MKTDNTKQSLLSDLKKSGIDPCGTLLVHSSVKSVGESENGADTILDAFIEFMKEPQEMFEQSMVLNMGQWLSIPFVLVGAFMVWYAGKHIVKEKKK